MMWLSTEQWNWRWRSAIHCWGTSHQLFSHQVGFEGLLDIIYLWVKVNLIMIWLSTGKSNWRWRSAKDCWSTSYQLFSHQAGFGGLWMMNGKFNDCAENNLMLQGNGISAKQSQLIKGLMCKNEKRYLDISYSKENGQYVMRSCANVTTIPRSVWANSSFIRVRISSNQIHFENCWWLFLICPSSIWLFNKDN